jgi:mRNA-degrading endonuclease RelE of RelBE toxin-antitoxin system
MQQNIGNTIVETMAFLRDAAAVWSEKERETFKDYLSLNPMAGDEIPGTGGLRKIRWSRSGMGKRGGVRVIYYYYNDNVPVFLLSVYAKSEKENLLPHEMAAFTKAATVIKQHLKLKGEKSWNS